MQGVGGGGICDDILVGCKKKKNKMVAVRKFHVASNFIAVSNESLQCTIFTEHYLLQARIWRDVVRLLSLLCLDLLNVLFLFRFSNHKCISRLPHVCSMPRPAQPLCLYCCKNIFIYLRLHNCLLKSSVFSASNDISM